MTNYKFFLKSTTIQSALIGLIASLLLFFMVKNVNDKYYAMVAIISHIGAIIGRLKAKEKITVRRKPNGKSK